MKCVTCGNEFYNKGNYKYCSSRCAHSNIVSSSNTLVDRACEHCGKVFTVKRISKAKYCSTECRRKVVDSYVRECELCSTRFRVRAGKDTVFCSDLCAENYEKILCILDAPKH